MSTWQEDHERRLRENAEYRAEWERTQPLHGAIDDVIHLRSVHGISQAQLAERMGRKQPSIGRFEAGNTNPTLGFLQDIAEALGARLVVHIEPKEPVAEAGPAEPKRKQGAASRRKRRAGAAA